MFRNTLIAGVLAAAAPALALAADPTPAPTPEHTVTGNVGIFSQYIFRGLTQTDRDPAIQGGFDYAHSSGIYAGTWGSNISWLKENFSTPFTGAAGTGTMGTYSQGGSLELDFYGGYKTTFGDFGLDVGTLYYWYPGKINPAVVAASAPNNVPKADTWEIYAGGSWKWLSAKYSYSIMDKTFGVKDSKGTWYLDLTATVPLGDFAKELTGITLLAHWGYQKYNGTDPRNFVVSGRRLDNDDMFSYKDVKLGVSYLLPKDFTVGAFYSRAYDTNVLGYGSVNDIGAGANRGPFPRDIAKGTGTIYVQKTF